MCTGYVKNTILLVFQTPCCPQHLASLLCYCLLLLSTPCCWSASAHRAAGADRRKHPAVNAAALRGQWTGEKSARHSSWCFTLFLPLFKSERVSFFSPCAIARVILRAHELVWSVDANHYEIVWKPHLKLGRLIQCQCEKSIILSPGLLTRDQKQVLKSCVTPFKVYNRGTLSMGSIFMMNICHEHNRKPSLC
jgi:hypothetical protein